MPQEETQDKVLGLIPARGGPGRHCSAAVRGESVGAAAWGRCLETGAGVSGMGLEDGTQAAHRGLEVAAGCRGGIPVEARGDGSSRPDGQRGGHGGGRGGGRGGGAYGDDGCCFRGNDGDCCGCDGGFESDDLFDCADASWEGCAGCVQECGISLACSEDEVCDLGAAPRAAWGKRGWRWGQSSGPTWTAEKDAAFWGSGCHPFCPGHRCTYYLDENVTFLLPQDDVCGVRGPSVAAFLLTESSPVCAAGSPCDCGRGDEAPSRGCSAEGSFPLRWRASGSRSLPSYLRC